MRFAKLAHLTAKASRSTEAVHSHARATGTDPLGHLLLSLGSVSAGCDEIRLQALHYQERATRTPAVDHLTSAMELVIISPLRPEQSTVRNTCTPQKQVCIPPYWSPSMTAALLMVSAGRCWYKSWSADHTESSCKVEQTPCCVGAC